MADPIWPMVRFLIVNDVIMTSLLLLKIIDVLANLFIFSNTQLFKVFFALSEKISGILQINSTIWVIFTLNFKSNCSNHGIKLCLDVANDEYVILCNSDGLIIYLFIYFISFHHFESVRL